VSAAVSSCCNCSCKCCSLCTDGFRAQGEYGLLSAPGWGVGGREGGGVPPLVLVSSQSCTQGAHYMHRQYKLLNEGGDDRLMPLV